MSDKKAKLCLVCKKYISLENFSMHFRECRKKQLSNVKLNINPKTMKKSGGCGCGKKRKEKGNDLL
jgi:ABC-type bacteriocin/lantibiotic exporter with double-glycine peptidase domain